MNDITITLLGITFIFFMTSLGSAIVFLFKKNISEKINSLFLGFSSGLMIAASIWSLLLPALEQSTGYGSLSFIPAAVGIILGGLFLVVIDKIIAFFINRKNKTSDFKALSRSGKLFLAVTLHNIPEGLAVGLAFGNAFLLGDHSVFYSALWLAIGIGIQNFPEGAALSLPIKEETKSKKKGFLLGVASGIVEPIMSVIGIFLSSILANVMPWLLAFSAGAMLFVVAEELLPDARLKSGSNIGTWGFVMGFVLMMILDVALG